MRPRLRSLAPTAIVLIASSLLVDRAARAQSHIHTPEASAKAEELSWLHISGQLRERGTYLSAIEYDNAAEAAGWFWTQRAVLSADVQATSSLRGRVTLQSALIQGGEEDAPIERNDLDVQEAFVELGPKSADLRLGRQEIRLGSQRLVAVRDGTNVRRAFDGARLQVDREEWRFDAFALRLVDVDVDGVFNDGRDEGQNLVGVYVTAPARFGEIDLYYLYTEFDDRPVIEGRRDERRHSVGARAFGERQGWFWDWEAIYQFGAFDRNDIRAWTAAANTGYRWENVSWRPEIMLSTNIASGDSDPNDGRFETFNALYPGGAISPRTRSSGRRTSSTCTLTSVSAHAIAYWSSWMSTSTGASKLRTVFTARPAF